MLIIMLIFGIIFPMIICGQLIAEHTLLGREIQKEIDTHKTQSDQQQKDDLSNWEKTCQQINHSHQQKI